MTIELSKDTVGIWAVSLNDGDWLASVWREGDLYVMEYRFRYYVDDLTFDSKDRKNWYRCELKVSENTEAKLVAGMRVCARMLWQNDGGKRYEVIMDDGGVDQMMEDFSKWPMITMKSEAVE